MKKNIYLTVTAGRTGTGYLQQMFKILPDFTAIHEPQPLPAGKFWEDRLKQINALGTNNYIETSHLICKGWIEPLMQQGIIPRLIILKRGARVVALSLFKLNTIPGRTNLGKRYLINPPNSYNKFNDYQLCYWYCLEIEKKQEYYKKLILSKGGFAFETSINQLKDARHYTEMLDYFNIEYNDDVLRKYNSIKNEKINTQKSGKKRINKTIYTDAELGVLEQSIVKQFKNDNR